MIKVLVLNGSPSGQNSITLYTVFYIQKFFPQCEFEVLDVGQRIKSYEKDFSECESKLKEADLILFCYPVYTFLVPSQLHLFIELIKEHGIDLGGKYATQITTSKHFYDMTAHAFIQDNCNDLSLKYVRGLSADMEDLMKEQGQQEALSFFRYVLWSMENGFFEPVTRFVHTEDLKMPSDAEEIQGAAKAGRAVIIADLKEDSVRLRKMVERFEKKLAMQVNLVNIEEFPFDGGCLGCFHCASDGKCIYKDGFDDYLRNTIQTADALVYAFEIKDHSMGSRFKMFDDRQFCNGHRTVTMGKPVAYLIDGHLDEEANLKTLIEARAQVGGNYLAAVASSEHDPDRETDQAAAALSYAYRYQYQPPKNFYGVGGLKVFRDLIYQMQGLMKADHEFYKEHGFYDFPQKQKGKIAAMYLVGSVMRNPKLSKKIGSKMTEGMIMPYKRIVDKAK